MMELEDVGRRIVEDKRSTLVPYSGTWVAYDGAKLVVKGEGVDDVVKLPITVNRLIDFTPNPNRRHTRGRRGVGRASEQKLKSMELDRAKLMTSAAKSFRFRGFQKRKTKRSEEDMLRIANKARVHRLPNSKLRYAFADTQRDTMRGHGMVPRGPRTFGWQRKHVRVRNLRAQVDIMRFQRDGSLPQVLVDGKRFLCSEREWRSRCSEAGLSLDFSVGDPVTEIRNKKIEAAELSLGITLSDAKGMSAKEAKSLKGKAKVEYKKRMDAAKELLGAVHRIHNEKITVPAHHVPPQVLILQLLQKRSSESGVSRNKNAHSANGNIKGCFVLILLLSFTTVYFIRFYTIVISWDGQYHVKVVANKSLGIEGLRDAWTSVHYYTTYMWDISARVRNKLMHSLHGNTEEGGEANCEFESVFPPREFIERVEIGRQKKHLCKKCGILLTYAHHRPWHPTFHYESGERIIDQHNKGEWDDFKARRDACRALGTPNNLEAGPDLPSSRTTTEVSDNHDGLKQMESDEEMDEQLTIDVVHDKVLRGLVLTEKETLDAVKFQVREHYFTSKWRIVQILLRFLFWVHFPVKVLEVRPGIDRLKWDIVWRTLVSGSKTRKVAERKCVDERVVLDRGVKMIEEDIEYILVKARCWVPGRIGLLFMAFQLCCMVSLLTSILASSIGSSTFYGVRPEGSTNSTAITEYNWSKKTTLGLTVWSYSVGALDTSVFVITLLVNVINSFIRRSASFFLTYRTKEIRFNYAPMVLSCLLKDCDRYCNNETAYANVHAKIRRLACLPVKAQDSVAVCEGTEKVAMYCLTRRSPFFMPVAECFLPQQ